MTILYGSPSAYGMADRLEASLVAGETVGVAKLTLFKRRAIAVWNALQFVSVVAGLLLLLLLQIPWLKAPLDKIGLNNSESLRTTILVLVLTALFGELYEVSRMASEREGTARQQTLEPVDVYPSLISRALAIRPSSERRLDVLGMTLYTAWPLVSFWLRRPETANWTVRLAAMKDVHGDIARWVPDEWHDEAKVNVAAARRAAASEQILKRGIVLEVFEYDFVPTVHGFRLSNDDLYISFLLWQFDGRLGTGGQSYEYVPGDEKTASAEALRRLFDTWFVRAMRSGQEPGALLPEQAAKLIDEPYMPSESREHR